MLASEHLPFVTQVLQRHDSLVVCNLTLGRFGLIFRWAVVLQKKM